MCECTRHVSVFQRPWREHARAIIAMCEHTEQSGRNLRYNLVLSQAWRLYDEMCTQRRGERGLEGGPAFTIPPLTPADVPEWCHGLLAEETPRWPHAKDRAPFG